MSALRIPGPDGHTILVPIDDGCSPHRSSRGIRGSIGEPVFGMFVVGESQRARDLRKQRAAMGRTRAERKTPPRPQRTDYGWGLYAPEDETR